MVEVGGSNPPGPTKFLNFCFYSILFFQNRPFWHVSVRRPYRAKVAIQVSFIVSCTPEVKCFVFVQ